MKVIPFPPRKTSVLPVAQTLITVYLGGRQYILRVKEPPVPPLLKKDWRLQPISDLAGRSSNQ
jgi:hypothetical protein